MRTAATAQKRDRGDRGGLGGTSSDGDADEDGGEDGNECSGGDGDVDVGGSCQGRVPVSTSWAIGRSTVSRTADDVASFNAGYGASRVAAGDAATGEDGGNGGRSNLPTRPATTAGGGGGSDGDGDGDGSDIGGAARVGPGPAAVSGAA
jgi:hypothetical protein